MFGGAYDDADAGLRPKYGSLNFRRDPYGGSPRFGSAYFEVAPACARPRDVLLPRQRARTDRLRHVRPDGAACRSSTRADSTIRSIWYIEAHLHGRCRRRCRPVGAGARSVVPRHDDRADRPTACRARCGGTPATGSPSTCSPSTPTYRGAEIVAAAEAIAVDGDADPADHRRRPCRRATSTSRRSSASGTTWRRFGRRDPAFVFGKRRSAGARRDRSCGPRTASSPTTVTPAGHVHALDVDAARRSDDHVPQRARRRRWAARRSGRCAASTTDHGELKSMHTARPLDAASAMGRAMLDHLLAEARGGRRAAGQPGDRHDGRVRAGARRCIGRQDSSSARRSASTRQPAQRVHDALAREPADADPGGHCVRIGRIGRYHGIPAACRHRCHPRVSRGSA